MIDERVPMTARCGKFFLFLLFFFENTSATVMALLNKMFAANDGKLGVRRDYGSPRWQRICSWACSRPTMVNSA